jgi:hypothetical protein
MFLQFSNFQSETSANRRTMGSLCVTGVTANIVLCAIIAGEGWIEGGSQPRQNGLACSVGNISHLSRIASQDADDTGAQSLDIR